MPSRPGAGPAAELDRQIAPLLASEDVPGLALGVSVGGAVRFRGYGAVALDGGAAPDEHTLFETGSVGKVLTALLLADAVVRGELSLATRVEELLPPGVRAPRRGGRSIELGHLAAHTSGLPREPADLDLGADGDRYAGYGEDRLWRAVDGCELATEPGSAYAYSNLGAGLLGRLLVRALGAEYGELVRARVSAPLGLADTVLEPTAEQAARVAQPTSEGLPRSSWGSADALSSAGALRSTAADTLRLALAHLAPERTPLREALELVQVPRFTTPGGAGVALGWHTEADGTLWHNGSTGGYHAYVAFHRGRGLAVALLANGTSVRVTEAGERVARVLAGERVEPLEVLPVRELEPERLTRLVGRYVEPASGAGIEVVRAGAALLARVDGQVALRLYPRTAARFAYRAADAEVEFAVGPEGPASALTLIEGSRELRFARRTPASERRPPVE